MTPETPRPIKPHGIDVYFWSEGGEQVQHTTHRYDDAAAGSCFGDHVYMLYEEIESSIPAYNRTEPVAACIAFEDARFLARTATGNARIGRGMEAFIIIRTPRQDMPPEASRNLTLHDRLMEDPAIRAMYQRHARRAQAVVRQRRLKQSCVNAG